ncbi:unnamed protein product [Brachionus calyciflorus]|uniref:Uncharacterized protein n=1 Tax=Brachionus calyciflorus TaxID=104777 RepID=A0A813MGZ3_9BILA|nr:unnamed protein product [Brachionus calyciflorus]
MKFEINLSPRSTPSKRNIKFSLGSKILKGTSSVSLNRKGLSYNLLVHRGPGSIPEERLHSGFWEEKFRSIGYKHENPEENQNSYLRFGLDLGKNGVTLEGKLHLTR